MAHAEIHEFTSANVSVFDDFGDPLLGFYFVIVDDDEQPKMMMGPYGSAQEAELASVTAWEIGDFHEQRA